MNKRIITPATRRLYSSIPGESIRFVTEEEWKAFQEEYRALIRKHEALMINRYGEWSDQEDGYVGIDWVTQDKVPPREGKDQVKWGS